MNTKVIIIVVGVILVTVVGGYLFTNPPQALAPEREGAGTDFTGTYLWQNIIFTDDTIFTPTKFGEFTLQFDEDRISFGTDCNSGSASYLSSGREVGEFKIGAILSTKMYCEGSEENRYFSMLSEVVSYSESVDGTLSLVLEDGDVMNFVPAGQ
ncbi:MAG: META domain-containing protein [Candidatus Paceibacteria bacterium]